MGAFELLAQLGVRVFQVPNLDVEAVYQHGDDGDRAFVRAGLSPQDLRWAADELLAVALESLLVRGPE
jgi:hypothetical protein